MYWKPRWITAAIVAAVQILVSGCCALGHDDENEGQFCASPSEGDTTFCVPASDGPGDAYNKAKAAGPEPIQMWVLWSKNLTLREVVVHPNLLKTWLDDDQT